MYLFTFHEKTNKPWFECLVVFNSSTTNINRNQRHPMFVINCMPIDQRASVLVEQMNEYQLFKIRTLVTNDKITIKIFHHMLH